LSTFLLVLSTILSPISLSPVFIFRPLYHCLLSSDCDRFSIVWLSSKNNFLDISKSVPVFLYIDANRIFQDIDEDLYDDNEFLNILQEWHDENKENMTEDRLYVPPAKKFKKT
jgi:hypothetical protein